MTLYVQAQINTPIAEVLPVIPAIRLVYSTNSKKPEMNATSTKVYSVKCRMLRANLRRSLTSSEKLAELERRRPHAAALVVRLVDRLLEEVS